MTRSLLCFCNYLNTPHRLWFSYHEFAKFRILDYLYLGGKLSDLLVMNNDTTMRTDLLLRPIRPQDSAPLKDVIIPAMAEFGHVGPGYSSEDAELDDLYSAYSVPGAAYFVLEKAGQVVGGGGIGPLAQGEADTCELRKMYFAPSVRGQGWGRRLIDRCLETARALGYRRCYLETSDRMEAANHLYHKMGFRTLHSRMGDTGHSSCSAYYVKDLTQAD